MDEVVEDRVEVPVRPIDELVDDAIHVLVRVVDIPGRVRARRVVIEHLFRLEAKDDAVLIAADGIADLDVRAVERAERDGAVHHELHVARARSFLRSRGDLLTDIGRRIDDLADGDAEVLDEYDLDLALDARIVVDLVRDGIDQADRLLRAVVARCSLAAEEVRRRQHVEVRIRLELVVLVHDVQDVHELALV